MNPPTIRCNLPRSFTRLGCASPATDPRVQFANRAHLPGAFAATIPGGQSNMAGGQFSFAAGRRAIATNDGAFVWADSVNLTLASTKTNSITMRAADGYRLFSIANATAGVFLVPGGTFWSSIDDRVTTTQELGGVALAAIQGLNQKVEGQRAELGRKAIGNCGTERADDGTRAVGQ